MSIRRKPATVEEPMFREQSFRRTARAVCMFVAAVVPCAPAAAAVDEMVAGYDHFYNLEYSQAILCFEKAAAQNPHAPSAQNGVAQSVLYREMLRTGALDSELVDRSNSFLRRPKMEVSPAVEESFTTAINSALALSQRALDQNPRDLESLHARAVSFAYRSNWSFLVHKAHSPRSDLTLSSPGYRLKAKSRKSVSGRYLTIEECQRLLSMVSGADHLAFRILIQRGLRSEELFALRRDDVSTTLRHYQKSIPASVRSAAVALEFELTGEITDSRGF